MTKTLLKAALTTLAIISGGLFLTGCGQTADKGNNKVINVGITNDPKTVNPLMTNNVAGSELSSVLFLPLAQMNSDLKYTYRLAKDITTEDNTNFIVSLNKDIKWTDGKPVTADDVIFTLNTVTDPAVKAAQPYYFNAIKGTDETGRKDEKELSGVKKIDDHTISIETKYPIALDVFNNNISSNLKTIPKHVLSGVSPETINQNKYLQEPTVTDGPFKYVKYVAGQYLSLVANDDYYLGKPKIQSLNFKILSGTQITVQLENGEIDMNYPLIGNIPSDDYARVKTFANVRTIEGIPSNVQVLFINCKAIDNVKVRQAIDLAIDRESILKNILKGEGEIYKTPITSRAKYWNQSIATATYNPEKAKQLIQESGWDTTKEIVFSVPAGNATREKAASIIAEELKAVGLNVVIRKADLATTLGNVQKRKYDLSIIGMPDVPLNSIKYLRVYASSKYTWTNYSNPEADTLVDRIEREADEAKLQRDYYHLQELIANEVPVTGIYSELPLKAVNKRIIYAEPKEYGFLNELEKWDVK